MQVLTTTLKIEATLIECVIFLRLLVIADPLNGSQLGAAGARVAVYFLLIRLDRPSRDQTKGIRRISPWRRPLRPVYPLLANLSKIALNNSIFQRVKCDHRHAATR